MRPRASRSGALATPPRPPRGRGVPGVVATALAALLTLAPIAACGGGDAETVAAREELEERFGRRDVGGEAADSGAVEPGTDAPGDVAEGAPPTVPDEGETDAPAPEVDPERGDGSGGAASGPPAAAGPDTAADPSAAAPPREEGFDPDRWLAMADSAYRRLPSLRARFEQRVEVPLLDRTSTGVGIWYQRGRDRFRMDFTEPPDDLFVADGTHLWLYQPSQQPDQVVRTALAAGAAPAGTADLLGRILAEARTAYDAVYEGTETVSGVETHVIELTPRGPSEYREVRVWIAASDRLVRRFRIEQENEMVRTVTLADLEPGATLSDSLFRFTVPEGVDVFDG